MAIFAHGRARISSRHPQALGVCDQCGFTYNRVDLSWQMQWAGPQLQNQRMLVCRDCYDVPQEQLRSIRIPPDPLPIRDPRPEPYSVEVPSFLSTESLDPLATEAGDILVTESALPQLYP